MTTLAAVGSQRAAWLLLAFPLAGAVILLLGGKRTNSRGNLFLAAMLLLVLGDNYLGLYAGWEGVGLASYLLIGFWYFKPTAATAAKKAFIANRVGDAGLSIAIMLMFATFGTIQFPGVFQA